MEARDVVAVADLYELVIRSGHPAAPPELVRYVERLTFDQPSADPELPSLVFDDPDAGILGFIAAYPRRFLHGKDALRVVCSGQLVAHPDARSRGVGALLLRKLLAGPQDLTMTDGATEEVRVMWERLGGMSNPIASTGWTRVLSPARHRAEAVARRLRLGHAPAPGAWRTIDRAVRRRRAPTTDIAPGADGAATPATSRPLAVSTVLDELPRLARRFPVRPAYDAAMLEHLFDEMAEVTSRGPLVRREVRHGDDRCAGWYVAYVPPGGVAQVVQIAGADLDVVLETLAVDAEAAGATALQGRIDPYLHPFVRDDRYGLHPTAWSLVHAREPAVLA
ncbi:MAG TPA: hypothetical protein VFZ79_11575, partial [Acidimicrobiales bacterium]